MAFCPALCEFMHGAARVCWAPFPTRAQHQHSRRQLRLRVCLGGHAEAHGEGVGGMMVEWASGVFQEILNCEIYSIFGINSVVPGPH